MAVYNERPYLGTAVRSVLNQTLSDFEFIIVNDGSTDGSGEVLDWFEHREDRIRLINQENRGLKASLNRGLGMATGEYVAIMDGDDICYPERFRRQVSYLDENPKIGILGTQADKIDAEGNLREEWKRSLPTDPDAATWRLLFNTCFCHPTAMMRRSILEDLGGYARDPPAMDYELFARAVLKTRLVNLSDTLFQHRRHEGSISVKERDRYTERCAEAAATLHRALLGQTCDEEFAKLLVWQERKGLQAAIKETEVRNFPRVHEHLRFLYQACTRRLFSAESNTRVQRRALRKLDSIANQVLKSHGLTKGILYKLRSWSILSAGETIPLVREVLLSRISRFSKFYPTD